VNQSLSKSFFLQTHYPPLRRTIAEAIGIVLFSSVVGLLHNFLSPWGIQLLAQPEENQGWEKYASSLEMAKEKFDSGEVLFFDARSADDYAAGHIRGAQNFPTDEIETQLSEIFDLLIGDKEVITYCGGEECHSSTDLADALRAAGCIKVWVFYSGWIAWKESGYPVEYGPDPGVQGSEKG